MNKELKIDMKEYMGRRQVLLSKMSENSIAILYSGQELYRNGDTHYPFRQKSDFYYLTGFNEPESVMVLLKSKYQTQYILFCRPKNASLEIWTGPRVGIEDAEKTYLVDKAYSIETLNQHVPSLLENISCIYYTLGFNKDEDQQLINWVDAVRRKTRFGISAPETWQDLLSLIHAQRMIKSDMEIKLLREAARISAGAHTALMRETRKMQTELELEGRFIQYCAEQGAQQQAYPCIVGSGKNACILHYTENSDPLAEEGLILVDAGCEYQNYASDVTRTFPRTGRFTEDQKALYSIVLEAQKAAIAKIKPGLGWHEIQETMLNILLKGLSAINILHGTVKALLDNKAYQRFYMHSSGHWLGLDVHDVGHYKIDGHSRLLEEGMVFTIEPGIYIAGNQLDIDRRWWNIGIRIEDDILVTAEGCEVLSQAAPKEINEIEYVMQNSLLK